MHYDPDIHHRRSIRLPGYDYSWAGAYFVTLCTQDRACLFGEVTDGQVRLNQWGCSAATCWAWLAEQYSYVTLDAWVVMPNHLHGIIVLLGADEGGSRTAPTTEVPRRKPLGGLIGAFKTVSTKRINEMRGTPGLTVWQRNYYEHIIRAEEEFYSIRSYIDANPLRWTMDRENPDAQALDQPQRWEAQSRGGSRTALPWIR